MNDDIGYNIKTLAKIIGIALFIIFVLLGVGAAYYVGIFSGADGINGLQIICVLAGVLLGALGYISAWVLYGFGQIITDIRALGHMVYELKEDIQADYSDEAEAPGEE